MSEIKNKPKENTSYISNIVYNIENMLLEGASFDTIKSHIEYLKEKEEFPENLELAETLFDEKYSVGACAFVDTNTGETIVGFAGTNSELINLLNFTSNVFWEAYLGEEIFIKNGEGHTMIEFLNEAEQEFLLNVLRSKGTNEVNNLSVSFEGGALCELEESDLIIKNLWGEGGKYSGIIVIDAEAFRNLSNNLVDNMAMDDIKWIKDDAIRLCREKNDTLKNKKESRDEDLAKGIVEGLEGLGFTGLVNSIEESHGYLIENKLLFDLGNFNKELSLQKFSGSKRWLLDGEYFTKSDISQMLTDIQRAAQSLYFEVTETREFDEYLYTSHQREELYKPQTISSIVEAYANLTNSFLEKTQKVFEGKGKRLGKTDGVVDAISEVLDAEEINIDEVRKQIHTVGEIAGGIAENFSNMDEYLSGVMQDGQGSGQQFIKVPDSYEAYLQEHDILSDVVDIIEAYDLQVKQVADELSREIILRFEDLINTTQNKINQMNAALVAFKKTIMYLRKHMYKEVTTIEVGETIVEDYRYTTKEIKKSHGMLRDFFTEDVRKYISQAQYSIIPIIGDFEYVWTCLDIYKGGLYDIRNYIASIIEKAIYDHYDLDEIISAQKLIIAKTSVMIKEIKKVNNGIEAEFKGKSVDKYQVELDAVVKSLQYFNSLIRNCFGNNL